MSEKTKLLLGYMQQYIDEPNAPDYSGEYPVCWEITTDECECILNYIKNLQQRIDKAIEYIEENKNKAYAPYGDNEDYDYETCLDEDEIKYLLEILKGDNND